MTSIVNQLPSTDLSLIPPFPTEWLKPVKNINDAIARFPDFFSKYRNSLAVIGLATLGLIVLYIINALIAAINSIPLLGSFFEAVGLAYSIWFFLRYFLFAVNRAELKDKITSLPTIITG